METFEDLGLPFPLFLGSVDTALEYEESAPCCLCGAGEGPAFRLAEGAELLVDCPDCGARAALDAGERPDWVCACGQQPFPWTADELFCCYDCLREGLVWLHKDTEGMALPEDLLELRRTPAFTTWQEWPWPFCCRRPMIYLATTDEEGLGDHLPDVQLDWEGPEGDDYSIYLFQCQVCRAHRMEWDQA